MTGGNTQDKSSRVNDSIVNQSIHKESRVKRSIKVAPGLCELFLHRIRSHRELILV